MLLNVNPSGIVSTTPPIWNPDRSSITSNVESGTGLVVDNVRVAAGASAVTIGAIANIAMLIDNTISAAVLLSAFMFLRDIPLSI
ncbi:MAG: hypothetical protein C5S38_07245 [Candidatus Methanophagaceae archaeon]|nr:MAG: hypothetical protein C5S38_07245 [Methanophagales archaeon]